MEQDGSGPAALRMNIPQSDIRISTHFIALIDVSESMSESSKLTHVKHCMSLLLQFLTADDALSIVTFGDASTIVLNHMKTSAAHRPIIEKAIESLEVNGCTNYSAGLGSVRQILDASLETENSVLKPGLLTFTDGHANRGVSEPAQLTGMISRIRELYPTLSMSFIAYGTDHNATLLKSMADSVMGSYSIVNSLEGAATAMGDCLGSIISCAAQNVVVECPVGTTVEGPYTVVPASGRMMLGDLYTGIETTILLNAAAGQFKVTGTHLPSLDPFTIMVQSRLDTTPNVEIILTRLRYRCAELFREINASLHGNQQTEFTEKIAEFRAACNEPLLADHPVTAMLKTEILSMEAAVQNIIRGEVDGLDTELTQHAAFTTLLRGTTTTIQQDPSHRHSRRRLSSTSDDPGIITSPTRTSRQQYMSRQMRSSIGGDSS